jgi:hypothetical protein
MAGGGRTDADVRALYEQLAPGMSLEQVAALAGRPKLAAALAEPVSSWLLWGSGPDGEGTAVLRAAFQEGRVTRLEYEAFGEEYRRLAKGADPWIEVGGDELARIWRQSRRVEHAAESCRDALDAYHDIVVGAQERLVGREQRAWARALLLRQAVETALPRAGRSQP